MNVISFRIKGAFLYNGNELPDHTQYVNGSCLHEGPPLKKGSLIMVEKKDPTASFPFYAYAEVISVRRPKEGKVSEWKMVNTA